MLTNSQTKRNSSREPNNLSSHSGSKGRKYMDFYKAVYIYMLGGLVGTIWETLLNFARGRGFVYCNGSILTPFNFVYKYGAICKQNSNTRLYSVGSKIRTNEERRATLLF